jgi:hypothetical protein
MSLKRAKNRPKTLLPRDGGFKMNSNFRAKVKEERLDISSGYSIKAFHISGWR